MEIQTQKNNDQKVFIGTFPSATKEGHIYYKYFIPRQLDKDKETTFLFIVHGMSEHHGRHLLLPEYLTNENSEAQFVIVWLDQFGHGLSGGNRVHIEDFRHYSLDMITWFNLISQKFSDYKSKRILLGHSMGGLVALKSILQESTLLHFRVDALILSAPCIKVKQDVPALYYKTMQSLGPYLKKLRVPNIYSGEDMTSDPLLAQQFDIDPLIPNFITYNLLIQTLEHSKQIRSLAYFINIPTLFLIPGLDDVVDNEVSVLFANGISDDLITVLKYPQMKHEIFNEVDRTKVFHDVDLWLKRIETRQ